MSTQKRKFELFAKLQALGFTYDEAVSLRRIEMTLQRWGELECGNDRGCIERDETTGKPYFTYENGNGRRGRYAVADREKGAVRRLQAIVEARNNRACESKPIPPGADPEAERLSRLVYAYHQGDCRGCNLYLITHEQLTDQYGKDAGKLLPLDQYYTRGLAVCA